MLLSRPTCHVHNVHTLLQTKVGNAASRKAGGVEGIVNGMDPTDWNPTVDKYLDVTYDAETVEEGKALAKETLQAELGLDVSLYSFPFLLRSSILLKGTMLTWCQELAWTLRHVPVSVRHEYHCMHLQKIIAAPLNCWKCACQAASALQSTQRHHSVLCFSAPASGLYRSEDGMSGCYVVWQVDPSKPIFGFIGRLEEQKGIDILLEALPDIAQTNGIQACCLQNRHLYPAVTVSSPRPLSAFPSAALTLICQAIP